MQDDGNYVLTSSCPGKVLILGGYAVLEHPNPGLVIAVDARFQCTGSWQAKDSATQDVVLESPQWGASGWRGSFEFNPATGGLMPHTMDQQRNMYIERTVSWYVHMFSNVCFNIM
jgi:phosphomevalonate kinase